MLLHSLTKLLKNLNITPTHAPLFSPVIANIVILTYLCHPVTLTQTVLYQS